jgi:hypothetical protein
MRWAVISDPFLGNGSVNMFPRQWLHMQQEKQGDVYTVHAKEFKKKENWGNQSVKLCKGG